MTIMTYQVNNDNDQKVKNGNKKESEVKKHPDKKKESENSHKKRS